jgi:hypothetical protein
MCALSYALLASAAQQLIDELRAQFPSDGIMDVLGIVFPQYWRESVAAEKSFRKHLDVIKSHYGQPRWIGEDGNKRLIPPYLMLSVGATTAFV